MKLLFILITTSLITSSVQARLGETPEQIADRYGASLPPGQITSAGEFFPMPKTRTELHEKNGIYIQVVYLDGKCAWISYTRKREAIREHVPLTGSEVDLLITVNSPKGSIWNLVDKHHTEKSDVYMLNTPDSSIVALKFGSDGSSAEQLVIYTAAWKKHQNDEYSAAFAQTKEREKANAERLLTGF